MFLPDFHSDVPTGNQLLAEIGLDPQAIRETIEAIAPCAVPTGACRFPNAGSRTSSRPCRPARQPGVRGGLEKSERRGSGE